MSSYSYIIKKIKKKKFLRYYVTHTKPIELTNVYIFIHDSYANDSKSLIYIYAKCGYIIFFLFSMFRSPEGQGFSRARAW